MSSERVPWRADDPESGAVLIAERPIHLLWTILRPSFHRVFLVPHRPAGAGTVGWRWKGAAVPHPPASANLTDLRQRLKHALLDLTADLERRESEITSTNPKELLNAVGAIVQNLIDGTDDDLSLFAVETAEGWFIRSWGFSRPSPATQEGASDQPEADEETSEATPEASAAAPAEAPAETPAPPAHPPSPPHRSNRIRWAVAGSIIASVVGAFFWLKIHTRPAAVTGNPQQASAEHAEPTASPESASSETSQPTAEQAANTASTPTADHSTHAVTAHSEHALHAEPAAATTALHTPSFAEAPAHDHNAVGATVIPGAIIGVMPELPEGHGDHGAPAAAVSEKPEVLAPSDKPETGQSTEPNPAHAAESDSTAESKHAGADAETLPVNAPSTVAHAPEATNAGNRVDLAPDAPAAPAKDTPAGIEAPNTPDVPAKPPALAEHLPSPTPPAPAPEAEPTPPPESHDHAHADTNESATPPLQTPDAPGTAPLFHYAANEAASADSPPPAAAESAPAAPTATGAEAPPAPTTLGSDGSGAGSPAASASNETAATAPVAVSLPGSKTKPKAPPMQVSCQLGELKLRLIRDAVLPTWPTERAGQPTVEDASAKAWNGKQANKPESFRTPQVRGGWNFRAFPGVVWEKQPTWRDTTTGKPVDGLRASPNGLQLSWDDLIPKTGFSAHLVDDDGRERAKLTILVPERRIEVTASGDFSDSAPAFTVELASSETVAGAMAWRSRTPAWPDTRWQTQRAPRQISVTCLPTPPKPSEPTYGVVALMHVASGWALTWEVSTRPLAPTVKP
jgi:hypothetical protein